MITKPHRSALFLLLISILSLLAACGRVEQINQPSLQATVFTPTFTLMPASNTPILTDVLLPTSTLSPTETGTPTITPTPLDPIRNTPLTIMLHPSTAVFDAVQFLEEFIRLLKEDNYRVITYQDITENPDITATEKGRLAIITIDDIYLQGALNPSIERMISALLEAGYPAVLGVVTQGKSENPLVGGTLRDLCDKGWEVATHSDTHANLGTLEMSSPDGVYLEITTSQDKVEAVIGFRPITLILPYGQMVANTSPLLDAGITWVVGIGGGNNYDATETIHYVGREGPDGTPELTLEIMKRRFNPGNP